MSRVLMVASEAAPFVKTGGLADVLGGLPPALAALGEQVAVVLPKYRSVDLIQPERIYYELPLRVGPRTFACAIDKVMLKGVSYFFVNCPALFDRDGVYNSKGVDFPDNHIRFAGLCSAALETVRRVFRPDVIHGHDWQAALVPVYLRSALSTDPTFMGIKTLYTIHNLGYQGVFHSTQAGDMGLDATALQPTGVEHFGDINLMKGGIVFSDAVSTVSKAYAREIQTSEYGFGLDGLLRGRSADLSGILNGVDYAEWSPQTDSLLPAPYSEADLRGKRACKQELLERVGLPLENLDRPVIGIVSRMASQKGFDLIADVASELMQEDIALVVLGSGESRYEDLFTALRNAYPDRVGIGIGYNNPLAHLIEAGADMFLMPSHYEPCGLNQIYSLRYGTVPVVRATGGLDDTIDEETGFKFYPYTGEALLIAIRAALAAYRQPESWRKMMRRGMQKDFSWTASAKEYVALYQRLRGL